MISPLQNLLRCGRINTRIDRTQLNLSWHYSRIFLRDRIVPRTCNIVLSITHFRTILLRFDIYREKMRVVDFIQKLVCL